MKTRYTEAFLIGVGVGHLIEKYKGDFWSGLKQCVIEQQRHADIEKRRKVDVFGDTIEAI